MRVTWSYQARSDLQAIRDYIARDSAHYGRRFVAQLLAAAERLTEFPELGRRVPEAEGTAGIHEILYRHYRLIYHRGETITILTVLHASRDLEGLEAKPWDLS